MKELPTDLLLKLLEIIKDVDGSSMGDHIHRLAYQELKSRLGIENIEIPKREFIQINTSKDV